MWKRIFQSQGLHWSQAGTALAARGTEMQGLGLGLGALLNSEVSASPTQGVCGDQLLLNWPQGGGHKGPCAGGGTEPPGLGR